MDESETTTVDRKKGPTPPRGRGDGDGSGRPAGGSGRSGGGTPDAGRGPSGRRPEGGAFRQYKPEQGKATRTGTMVAGGALIAWGAYFIWDRLQIYQGDEWWRLLITTGIPIAFAVIFGGLLWWLSFSNRKSGDFMIATEGEMKKVNWSTRREIIGSTKVVILFTFLMAAYLFLVDIVFQTGFQWFGVLKR
jgi:preprotein translocase SecE subunit